MASLPAELEVRPASSNSSWSEWHPGTGGSAQLDGEHGDRR
jgi:hypothetical protein